MGSTIAFRFWGPGRNIGTLFQERIINWKKNEKCKLLFRVEGPLQLQEFTWRVRGT